MNTSYTCNVVIDLEFTRVPRKRCVNGLATEIIEVGAVKIGDEGTVVGKFNRMVKPTMAKGVSGMVHQMTGIGNEDLICAKPLDEVLVALKQWIGAGKARLVTWSDTDRKQIIRECEVKGIKVDLPERWLDIQRIYPRLMGLQRGKLVRLGDAADWCGITNDKSSAHRALYDAQITAEIYLMMASGDCKAQQEAIKSELGDSSTRDSCSSSLADRCEGLADLLASLVAQETLAA